MARKIEQEYVVKDKGSASVSKATKKINKSLQDTEKQSSNTTKSMSAGFKKAGVAIAAVFAAFKGITAIVNFSKEVIDLADNLDKVSTKLNISIEALDKLRRVGELAGVSFNTMTMGLQRMSRRVSEAAVDMGEARVALRELGLDAKILTQLPLEEQFFAVANAIEEVEGSSNKLRLTFKLFDSEGVALLQTFKGLEGQYKKTLTAFSEERVKTAVAFKDTMTLLSHTMQDLTITLLPTFLSLLIQMEPYLKEFANWLGMGSIDVQIDEAIKDVTKEQKELLKLYKEYEKAQARGPIESFFKGKLNEKGQDRVGGMWGSGVVDYPKRIAKQERAVENLTIKIQKLQKVKDQMNALDAKRAAVVIPPEVAGSEALKTELENRKNLIEQYYIDYLNASGQIDEAELEAWRVKWETKLSEYEQFEDLYTVALTAATAEREKILKEQDKRREEAADKLTEDVKESVKDMNNMITSELTTGLMSWIDGTKSASEAFKSMAAEFLKNIAQMIIQQTIFNALQGATGGGGGWYGAVANALFSADGNVFKNGNVTAFANGGVVNSPTMFPMANGVGVMGEAGTEAIMPLRRGANGKLGVEASGGGGGMSITNNITFNGDSGTKEDQDRASRELSSQIEAKIVMAIANEKRVGGQLNNGGMNRRTY